MAGVSESAFSTFMFNRAMQHKRGLMNDGVMRNDTMWDQLVFKKVREVLGGRVRFVATGAGTEMHDIPYIDLMARQCSNRLVYWSNRFWVVTRVTDFAQVLLPLAAF